MRRVAIAMLLVAGATGAGMVPAAAAPSRQVSVVTTEADGDAFVEPSVAGALRNAGEPTARVIVTFDTGTTRPDLPEFAIQRAY